MSLDEMNSPRRMDQMSAAELMALAQEIRSKIVDTVAKQGGHLASNLGIVELTIALHRAFTCPEDKFVFDVGHQCYPHKLLTGRAALFDTLREIDGLCGFPRMAESIYDCYGAGHASTAISAALGLARARDLEEGDHHVVAIVGDGAMTGGMCYEALNDAGNSKTRLIVILNDNGMSISGNVGALSNYLTYLRVSKGWNDVKHSVSRGLKQIPLCGNALYSVFQRFKDGLRNVFIRDRFFSSLGFRYLGPIDGQDISGLERVLRRAKTFDEPVLIHVMTKKGQGYAPAEDRPSTFHGTPPFRVEDGEALQKMHEASFGAAAARQITEMARENERIAVVTAAMTVGTGFEGFERAFPKRLFDVGIAEEHAVTMAAGLAAGGMRPVVAIYDTFLQRSFDQVIEDVCLQNLPVLFLLDRAGLSGHDGATHHGIFGVSYLAMIPNLKLFCPRDIKELSQMIQWAFAQNGPVAIRYPRAENEWIASYPASVFAPGRWETLRMGGDCALLAMGGALETALYAAQTLEQKGIGCQVINASSIKPLDGEALRSLDEKGVPVFTLEHQAAHGGLGGAVAEFCVQNDLRQPKKLFALPDQFILHGDERALLIRAGLDEKTVAAQILKALKEEGGSAG